MENQKLEDLLNISLSVPEEEREFSSILNVGYESESGKWELIVKYSGDLKGKAGSYAKIVELQNEYAIVMISEADIEKFSALPEVEFIEKPKRLNFNVIRNNYASHVINNIRSEIFTGKTNLTGEGIIIACIDSGVDYMHPDFRRENGRSRILYLWDQDGTKNPPEGYVRGTEYSGEQINEALLESNMENRMNLISQRDLSGHGTAVLGIAAGNGRASLGTYTGVAPESDIIVVKLGESKSDGFPRTTELMQALDYVSRKGIELNRPVAINLSFGNNYGGHDGDSLLETFIDSVANIGKKTICCGIGNEGISGTHTSGIMTNNQTIDIPFSIGSYETGLNLQIWKYYIDEMTISLITPSGIQVGFLERGGELLSREIRDMRVLMHYGEPSPYNMSQEIFIDLIPLASYLEPGLWKIRLTSNKILDGQYNIWMPGKSTLSQGTKFYYPVEETTLTIPSASRRVLCVGAYDQHYDSYAFFSGRGPTRTWKRTKPDLVAPGVGIMTTAAGGEYHSMTGTSFATPFVTGSAALLMEWGIVKGNDAYLYGEKVKAYLIKGARRNQYMTYPNNQWGYGVLSVESSLPR